MNGVVEQLRAHAHRRVRLADPHGEVVFELEESQYAAHRAGVVLAEVVIDQHQHLLRREDLVIATKLLHIAHALGVEQRLRARRALRDAPALAAVGLELQRPAQILLGLDVVLQQLQVQ